MGLMDDFLTELETDIRSVISGIPTGETGVERGVRMPDRLSSENYPHVFLTDPTEKSEELIYCQKKVEVSVQVILWRINQTHGDSLNDFTAIQAHLNTVSQATMGAANLRGVQVELEQIWETDDKPYRAAVMRVSGRRVV